MDKVPTDHLPRLRSHEFDRGSANQFGKLKAAHAGQLLIGVQDDSILGNADALEGGLSQPLKMPFAIPKSLLCLLALGDIPDCRDAHELSAGRHLHAMHLGWEGRAILSPARSAHRIFPQPNAVDSG